MTTFQDLELAIRARVPLIALVTPEEVRAEEQLLLPLARKWRGGHLLCWSITRGFTAVGDADPSRAGQLLAPDPVSALEVIGNLEEPGLFVLLDFHHFLDRPEVVRRLRDLARVLGPSGRHVILLGCRVRIPEDLEKEVLVIDYPPPGLEELSELLASLEAELGEDARSGLSPAGRERLLQAALGLTLTEAETVLARALVRDGRLTDAGIDLVLAEKRQIVRRSGVLEFVESEDDLAAVGGLASLKTWLIRRREAFGDRARDYGLPIPKGILLIGVQGCGKSLTARTVSRTWGMPLLRLDVGRLFGRYVGDSEAAVRRAIHTAEAVAPAVLWIDELEKGFAGATAQANDTGVSARVLGTFLTWMQEKNCPVFVIATANQVHNLPGELLRKGRFDELFFVDIPDAAERAEILAVQLRRRGRDPAGFDLEGLAAISEGFTGAEIEQVIAEGLFTAFADGRRLLAHQDLVQALQQVVPLTSTMREAVDELRQWAHRRTRSAS